jgi:predicted nucleic acid-binding Zn ribbon protein
VIRPLRPRHDGEDSQPVAVPDVLNQVLAGLGAPSVADVVAVHEHWPELVGEELVDHAQPLAIEDRTLRVTVDGPAWASHVRWSEADILRRLDRLLGAGVVTSVTTRVTRR